MAVGIYISIITLHVNGLNAPTKMHRLAEWIQKQDPYICYLQETHFRPKDSYRLMKVRGWRNIFHVICASDSFSTVVVLWGLWLLETMQTNLTLIVLKSMYICCVVCSIFAQIWMLSDYRNSVVYEHTFSRKSHISYVLVKLQLSLITQRCLSRYISC